MMLKLYVYGYLHRVQSSRRLEREASRNVELMRLTGKLCPDFKTIAEFRRQNADALRAVCRQYVILCRKLGLLASRVVDVDGAGFRAMNGRDRNFTRAKLARDLAEADATIARYLAELDAADQAEAAEPTARVAALPERIARLRAHMQKLKAVEARLDASDDDQILLTDPDARAMSTSGRGRTVIGYNVARQQSSPSTI